MADNSNDIFKQLQQHEMQPPADAFTKAWDRCLLTDTPINAADPFAKLKEYSLQAPAVDLARVMAGEKNNSSSKKIAAAPWMKAVAAILVLVAAAVIYLITNSKKDETTGIAKKEDAGNSSIIAGRDTNAVAPLTASPTGKKGKTETFVLQSRANTNNNKVNSIAATARPYKKKEMLSNWQFSGSDVLYTLINYKEKGQDKLFYRTLSAKKITLNQFSYINLSDKIVAMLQDLYVTKKNGKPARKAKKAKRKFEKWRKNDEKFFDMEPGRNPADIIDLSDFLMKN